MIRSAGRVEFRRRSPDSRGVWWIAGGENAGDGSENPGWNAQDGSPRGGSAEPDHADHPPALSAYAKRLYTRRMERKMFWLTFTVLGLGADFVLPLWWALGATIPIFILSWWVAYRSDWF